MLKRFFDWLFQRKTVAPWSRTAEMASVMRAYALKSIASQKQGNISCPWHMDTGAMCDFDTVNKTFHCQGCHRDGPLDTLVKRLNTRDAYEEPVV